MSAAAINVEAAGKSLPEGWRRVPLGELVDPNRPKIKPANKPELPFIGMEHIGSNTMTLLGTVPASIMKSNAVHFQPGDVLYGRLRPYLNKVFRPTFEGLCSAEFIVMPENDEINGKYLQYFLNSSAFVFFASHLKEGDRPRVDFKILSPYQIPIPPTKDDQERIVAEIEKQFSRLDEAVASLKRVKANLKRYKAAVLKAAVEGKLTEEWRKQNPDVEPASKLLERILTERRKKWEEAELAKMKAKGKVPRNDVWKENYKTVTELNWAELQSLPQGWVWVRLEQILESLCNGISAKPDQDDGLAILRISAVRPLTVNLDDVRYLPSESASDYEPFQLRDGDLLFTRYNGNPDFVGVCGMVKNISAFIVHPDKIIRGTVINDDDTKPSYLELALNAGESRAYIASMVRTTAGQSGVSGADIKNVPLPLPPSEEQNFIVRIVEREVSIIASLERHLIILLQRAEQLRQSILKKSFNGEVNA